MPLLRRWSRVGAGCIIVTASYRITEDVVCVVHLLKLLRSCGASRVVVRDSVGVSLESGAGMVLACEVAAGESEYRL